MYNLKIELDGFELATLIRELAGDVHDWTVMRRPEAPVTAALLEKFADYLPLGNTDAVVFKGFLPQDEMDELVKVLDRAVRRAADEADARSAAFRRLRDEVQAYLQAAEAAKQITKERP